MKQLLSIVLTLAMVFSLTACGNSSEATPAANNSTPAVSTNAETSSNAGAFEPLSKMTYVSMATGNTTGAMYIIGAGLCNVINQNIKNLDVTAQVTAATVENIGLCSTGDCEVGTANSNYTQWAYQGVTPFEGDPHNIRTLCTLYPSCIHIVVKAGSGIKTVPDMAGKRIAVGPPGSGNRLVSQEIFNYYGMTFDDIQAYDYTNSEMIDGLKDGDIDGFILMVGAPLSSIIDLCMTTKVEFVNMDDAMRNDFCSISTYYAPLDLPPDMYGTEDTVHTLGLMNSLIVNADVPDEVAYWITKGIFDHLDEVAKIHVLVSDLKVEDAVKTCIPMHPGAEKYFREIGAIK